MNKEEMMDKISEMENELVKLKEELNKQEKLKSRWKPKFNGKYYYIDSTGLVCVGYWEDYESDKTRYALGNVFKTQEEAEFVVEQLKVLAELKEYADDKQEWDGYNEHHVIYYDTNCNEITIDNPYEDITNPFNLYFSSLKQAEKAIDAIGEERLKTYYFCVEE